MIKNELPPKWYIKGCPELKSLCNQNRANIIGDYKNSVYFNKNHPQDVNFWRKWHYWSDEFTAIDEGFSEISFETFLKYLESEQIETNTHINNSHEPYLIKLLNNV